ncbi:hypothetical protein UT300016_10950 [Clostridium senegalense]
MMNFTLNTLHYNFIFVSFNQAKPSFSKFSYLLNSSDFLINPLFYNKTKTF